MIHSPTVKTKFVLPRKKFFIGASDCQKKTCGHSEVARREKIAASRFPTAFCAQLPGGEIRQSRLWQFEGWKNKSETARGTACTGACKIGRIVRGA
jgi:hypothetical protein